MAVQTGLFEVGMLLVVDVSPVVAGAVSRHIQRQHAETTTRRRETQSDQKRGGLGW